MFRNLKVGPRIIFGFVSVALCLITAQINDAQNSIASAVEEQTATTNEMARNVEEASKGSSEIAGNIAIVAQAADSTAAGATETQAASSELARIAGELQEIASRFEFDVEAPSHVPADAEHRAPTHVANTEPNQDSIFTPVFQSVVPERIAHFSARRAQRPTRKGEV